MVTTRTFYGVEVTVTGEPSTTEEMRAVFEILKPKASKTPLIRIGGDRDGSYLVPDELDGIVACFSPGVNRIKYFEDYLADNYGIASHMVDFSCDVDEFVTPLRRNQTFVKKWLDVRPGDDNVSLESWVSSNEADGDLILQMDIEGAEYRNILGTPDEILDRFRVIVLEVHTLRKMLDAAVMRTVIAPFFEKLARSFTTVHAHPNNCCGDFLVPGTDIRIPDVLELTLVRHDRFVPGPGPVALPHPLDVHRNAQRNPPLFLSDAWCDYERPLESRVTMLETTAEFKDMVGPSTASGEIASILSLTMQSIQTARQLPQAPTGRRAGAVEVAHGRPFELSSAQDGVTTSGVVAPSDGYFFHTAFGRDQSIRIDLGEHRRVSRIEITNRRGGNQERAKFIFAVLSTSSGKTPDRAFPMFKAGRLPGGAWRECAIDVPDVKARYVTITSPVDTALHFADVRVYADDAVGPTRRGRSTSARSALGRVRSKARRVLRGDESTTSAASRPAAGAQAAPDAAPPVASQPAARAAVPAVNTIDVIESCREHGIPIRGIIHVGANRGQEYHVYRRETRGPLLYIEAIPYLAEELQERLDPQRPHYVRQAVAADTSGETVSFNIASNAGASSSMLKAGRHAEIYPTVTFDETIELVTERLDDLVAERPERADYNVLVLDVQGAELKVLQGAPELLTRVDAVVAEISPEPLYEGGCTFQEVTDVLGDAGLVFRDAAMRKQGWGDAFYTRSRA